MPPHIYIYIYIYIYISAVKVSALSQITFNGTHFINTRLTQRIFCLTRGPTRSCRNGDAQCCKLSNSADPFSNFFPFKKASKPYLVLIAGTAAWGLAFPARAHTSLSLSLSLSLSPSVCSVSVQHAHTHLSLSLHLLSFCSARTHIERQRWAELTSVKHRY